MKSAFTILGLLLCAWNLSACSGQVISEDATTPEKASVIVIEKSDQRTRRYDCDGKLVSDRVEDKSNPQKLVEIHPTRSDWSYEMITGSDFNNKTTGDNTATVYDGVKFWIDINPAWWNLYVKKGVNEIRYEFNFTDGVVEKGSRFIRVDLQITHLDGVDELHPTKEECEAQH